MGPFKSNLPIAAAITIAMSILAGCRHASQSQGLSPEQKLIVRYAIAVLPDNDASRVITSVQSGNTTIVSLLTHSPTSVFQKFCLVTADFAVPNPPDLAYYHQLGDRPFVVKVNVGSPLVNSTTTSPASCGTIVSNSYFHIGGGTVHPVPPLQIGDETTDIAAHLALTGVYFQIGAGVIELPPLSISQPASGSGRLDFFSTRSPRRAAGFFRFIDSVPMTGSNTFVIVAEVDFDMTPW